MSAVPLNVQYLLKRSTDPNAFPDGYKMKSLTRKKWTSRMVEEFDALKVLGGQPVEAGNKNAVASAESARGAAPWELMSLEQSWVLLRAHSNGENDLVKARAAAIRRVRSMSKGLNDADLERLVDDVVDHMARWMEFVANIDLDAPVYVDADATVTNANGEQVLVRAKWEAYPNGVPANAGMCAPVCGSTCVSSRRRAAALAARAGMRERVPHARWSYRFGGHSAWPYYAALVSRFQPSGSSAQHGPYVMHFKPDVRDMSTYSSHGGTWETGWDESVAGRFTMVQSLVPVKVGRLTRDPARRRNNLYWLVARGDKKLVRLAMAEATGGRHGVDLGRVLTKGYPEPQQPLRRVRGTGPSAAVPGPGAGRRDQLVRQAR